MTLRQKVSLCLILNALIILGEMVGGWWISSVGLISDAAHNLIDQAGLFLTLYAVIMSETPATATRTFGHHRIGILAAFVNAVVLLIISLGIVALATARLLHPVPLPGLLMFGIALFSFVGNLSIALLLRTEAKGDLNVRAAFWHNLGDAWVSLGVILAGVLVAWTGWNLLDPLISMGIAGVIVWGAWNVLRESAHILLEGVPSHLESTRIAAAIRSLPGVLGVHDLHIWGVDANLPMLTCHVLIAESDSAEVVLRRVRHEIASTFRIHHMTIQVEADCCHPDALHCNLRAVYDSHPPVSGLACRAPALTLSG
jgi:cobalt-zinc-cadmium efflux system protein